MDSGSLAVHLGCQFCGYIDYMVLEVSGGLYQFCGQVVEGHLGLII